MTTDDRLFALLEPTVTAAGYELVHVEYVQGPDPVLRLYIDSPGGIGLDDCETVSREVSGLLDVEDPIQGHYQLEVSSPGLDRPLTRPEHFERFAGARVRVWLREARDGRRKFTGTLEGIAGEVVTVECDDLRLSCPLDDIEQVRLVPRVSF